jgi:hypothetical protein
MRPASGAPALRIDLSSFFITQVLAGCTLAKELTATRGTPSISSTGMTLRQVRLSALWNNKDAGVAIQMEGISFRAGSLCYAPAVLSLRELWEEDDGRRKYSIVS